jgi:hypothetical protein
MVKKAKILIETSNSTNNFRTHSIEITDKLAKNVKKEMGIYFTPGNIRKDLIEKTENHYLSIFSKFTPKTILEPSAGSGEFVIDLASKFGKLAKITAIELNSDIYNASKHKLCQYSNIDYINMDFLTYDTDIKYDFIIGNPPYSVVKRDSISSSLLEYCSGRPNLFAIIFAKCLTMLKQHGVISLILPTTFLNSAYYERLRRYIVDNMTILDIISYDSSFIDTKIDTIGIIILNTKIVDDTYKKFYVDIAGNIIFTLAANSIDTLLAGSTTLDKIGCYVKTGNVVWNQHKDLLTSDNTKTLLIYNGNIKDGIFRLLYNYNSDANNDQKRQYIDMTANISGPVILVNRGNGTGKYKFSYLLFENQESFLVENHLNVIYVNDDTMPFTKKLELLKKVVASFKDKRTTTFLDQVIKNGSLSKTELQTILPIWL